MTNSRDYITRSAISLTCFTALLLSHTGWHVSEAGHGGMLISDGENHATVQKYGDRVCVSPTGLSRIADLERAFDLVLMSGEGHA